MVEVEKGIGKSEISLKDVVGMFGDNYRQLVEKKALQLGISGLQFFDAPRPHNGSQALYLAEQLVGDDLVLVSVLRPHMQTSRHHHEPPMEREAYFHIAGESILTIDTTDLVLSDKQPLITVSLGASHQVKTGEIAALTLIVMENARLVSPGRLHVKAK